VSQTKISQPISMNRSRDSSQRASGRARMVQRHSLFSYACKHDLKSKTNEQSNALMLFPD